MLARTYRLRRSKDISQVYKRGRYSNGRGFAVKALKSNWPTSRAVIVVSRKTAKSAVVRNAIRRRLSGQLEQAWATVQPGYDIVISVREDISTVPAGDLSRELLAQFKRLELIDKDSHVSNHSD